jgi:tRNA dimethylallyltransferase
MKSGPHRPERAERPLIVISGPTGVGKSEIAVSLAREIGGEVVNYDSVQIYRGFDIGSAKPTADQRAEVPHHLFDLVEPDVTFTAADWAKAAEKVCAEIFSRGHQPILTGGTGFYLRALIAGLPPLPGADPAIRRRLRAIAERRTGPERLHRWLSKVDAVAASKIAVADRHRIERALEVWLTARKPISSWEAPAAASPAAWKAITFALFIDRKAHWPILDRRVERMYDQGLVEETRTLLGKYPPGSRPFGSIGYREAVRHLNGELTREEAIRETQRRTRSYAKRQMTWLRGERGVHWVDANPGREAALGTILQILRQ